MKKHLNEATRSCNCPGGPHDPFPIMTQSCNCTAGQSHEDCCTACCNGEPYTGPMFPDKKTPTNQISKKSLKEIKKFIKNEMSKYTPLKEQATLSHSCCDNTALNYNATCSSNPNCTCDNSCLTLQSLAMTMVSANFWNNISNLGCDGLHNRRNHLSNKLGVVNTPGGVTNPTDWSQYDFTSDNIGPGSPSNLATGPGTHAAWSGQISGKLFIIDALLSQNGC